jgi:hypothetical protein
VTVLQKLARKAIRFGVRPEEIGPVSTTFSDDQYMADYLRHIMGRWKAPAAYGVQQKDRDRARRAWDKLMRPQR